MKHRPHVWLNTIVKDYRTTAENIVSKMIVDEERYRFGKTKLFFRAGQVGAYY